MQAMRVHTGYQNPIISIMCTCKNSMDRLLPTFHRDLLSNETNMAIAVTCTHFVPAKHCVHPQQHIT